MKVFLTSHLNHYNKIDGQKVAKEIDNSNGLVDQIKDLLNKQESVVYFPTEPEDKKKVDEYSKLFFDALKLSGIEFDNYYVVDYYNYDQINDIVNKSDMIFLSGGNTHVQNKYFEDINLKEILKDYEGIIIGQSAGAINLAEDVYSSPEGEAYIDKPTYLKGLAKTNINVQVHFVLNIDNINKDNVIQRTAVLEESKKRPLYAICDVSHIYDNGIEKILYGEGYLIKDTKIKSLRNKQIL